MTDISIERDSERCIVEARGHAGADRNENGHDLVCASISMLCTTFAQAIIESQADDDTDISSLRLEPGDVCIDFEIIRNSKRINAFIDMLEYGFELLENQYPQNVRVL